MWFLIASISDICTLTYFVAAMALSLMQGGGSGLTRNADFDIKLSLIWFRLLFVFVGHLESSFSSDSFHFVSLQYILFDCLPVRKCHVS